MIPKIGNYNPGRDSPNTVWLRIGRIKVFFSYQQAIAFQGVECGPNVLCVNERFYSATTSKHLVTLKRKYTYKNHFDMERDFMEALEKELNNELRIL